MRDQSILLSIVGTGAAFGCAVAALPAAAEELTPRAFADAYCIECHNFDDYAGGIDLENFDFSRIGEDAQTGERIVRKLRAGLMPPVGRDRPERAVYEQVLTAMETNLDAAVAAHPVPAAPGAHRLNRREYANAIRTLLGLEIDPATLLPVDDTSYGFDNMAGSLGSSPALIEAYVSAAAKISRLALGHELAVARKEYHVPPDYSQDHHIEGLPFGSRGGLLVSHYFPADGEYVFNWAPVRANAGNMFGETAGEQLELSIDGERVRLWNLEEELPRDLGDEHFAVRVPVSSGEHEVALAFIARSHVPGEDTNMHFERTTLTQDVEGYTFLPHVNAMSISGPFTAARPQDTASRAKIFICYPATSGDEKTCATQILSSLATQAYRRPVTQDELGVVMDFYDAGREAGDFETGIQRGLQRILAEPKFIYRTESAPRDQLVAGQQHALSDLELASRLSFFLWSSPPDEELRELAVAGKLRDPETLEAQVERMLADESSFELTRNFAGQWLQLRNLQSASPVAELFPNFDDNLRNAFRQETELFFDSIIREDRPVTDLLDANYTFLNERLARHYGIPGVYGSQFRRVELPEAFDMRRGLLGKGSFLTVSSVADRTSTVLRGKWVLLNLLGVIPPDPPPNIPALDESAPATSGPMTLRQRMEMHGSNPACASCHQMLDPIGFALESFDRIGSYRETDNGVPLNLSATLVDGQQFNGPSELREALMQYSPQFVRTLTERLLTYALGRGVEYYDMPVVREIARKVADADNRFSALVQAIVASEPFQHNPVPAAAGNVASAN